MALSYTNTSSELPGIKRFVARGEDTSGRAWKRRKLDLNVGVESKHLHFTNLVDDGNTDVDVWQGGLYYRDRGMGGAWSPICHFPAIETDVLLYLAVLGGKKFSAYYNYITQEEYSTVAVFEEFRKRNGNRTHGNSQVLSRDFIKFENMVAHALFCASRRNGVRGIPFNNFFSGLVGEFQDEFYQTKPIDVSGLLERYAGLKEKFTDTKKIPFLAPPNAKWPDYLIGTSDDDRNDCKFGHLDRTDRYVVVSEDDDPLFVCECKYWKNDLDSGAMKEIIAGLNVESTEREGQRKPKWHNARLLSETCGVRDGTKG